MAPLFLQLVELLRAGHDSPAAIKAAETLEVVLEANAANERATVAAILERSESAKDLLQGFTTLMERLQKAAERVLMTAAERNDAKIFERAMKEAVALSLSVELQATAERRAVAVREQGEREEARRARRESLGLGQLSTPNEFLCPITQDVMIDPVVASDGHSYERSAIQAILDRGALDGGPSLSPLTREELEPSLVPNINLRKRIREHDNEVESVAQQVLNSVRHAQSEHASDGGGAGGGGSDQYRALMGGGGGGAAGSSSADALVGSAQVVAKLEALNLQRYASAFDEHGYDSWEEIVHMSEEQLAKLVSTVGILSNHADRLRGGLARDAASGRERSGPGGGGGGGGSGGGSGGDAIGFRALAGSGGGPADAGAEAKAGNAEERAPAERSRRPGRRQEAAANVPAQEGLVAGDAGGTTGSGGSRRSSPEAGAEQLVPPREAGAAQAAGPAAAAGGASRRKRESSGSDGSAAAAGAAAAAAAGNGGGRKVRRVGQR